MAEASFQQKIDAVYARLAELGLTVRTSVIDDLYPVLDRLYLRPEGEPDTADLVGRINETCDRRGIFAGDPVRRVEVLADQNAYLAHSKTILECELASVRAELAVINDVRDVLADAGYILGTPAERTRALMQERDDIRKQLSALRADLDAERAQLASKTQSPFSAFIDDAMQYVKRCKCSEISAVANGFRVTIEAEETEAVF